MTTNAGTPPRVYLAHGLLGTAYAHFGAQIRAWSGSSTVVPVDLPGHGRCPIDAEDRYLDQSLAYLTAIVERFGAGRLVAASYLGGPLAVRLATRRPDLVESLVLTGLAHDLPEPVFLRWVAGFELLADRNADLAGEYDRVHTPRWRKTIGAFAEDARERYRQALLVTADDLAALTMPLLIVNGSVKSAERHTASTASSLGAGIRGAVVEGGGHLVSHDRPVEFNRAVEAFWSGRPVV
jgi:pimeloyl-ACP methyl ester carboxylesterase